MTARRSLRHDFVDAIPDILDEGVLYASIKFATAIHLCCCGCRSEVVTPLSPTDWSLTFDGESVSLRPSIGNWSFPCQSHYWIDRNRVRWARRWTQDEITAGRRNDTVAKTRQFAPSDAESESESGVDNSHRRRPTWALFALIRRSVRRCREHHSTDQ